MPCTIWLPNFDPSVPASDNSVRTRAAKPVGAGAVVVMLMTPADVGRPNSVPCGPLSTSIRLTSNRSEILALPWLTWSTTTPTDATAPAEKVWVPMPRIDPPPPVF